MYSKILLALKPGSDCSGLLRTASALAVRFNAGIVVCHVSTSPGRWNGCALNLLPDDHIRELSTRIEREFRPNMSRVKQCYFLTLTGIPHVEILRLARRIQPDLIMMGSWRDPKRLQRTSGTLEQVGRNAQCPVMVVEEPFDELNFTKILAATDFSPAAGNAVDYAAQLAELSAAHLQLFHAMDETAHSPADIQKATDFAGRLYGHILKRQARITVQ
ncbi:MAG: universal stress protein, partial [Desulfovibrionales bacterium]